MTPGASESPPIPIRVAIVTGGARGIGRACALALAGGRIVNMSSLNAYSGGVTSFQWVL